MNPLFVSVTYGAGGSTRDNTLEIVTRIKREHGLEPMAHLTCVGAAEDSLRDFLSALTEAGVDNVLALRGDPPQGERTFTPDSDQFRHALDLVRFIRRDFSNLDVGVAGYPERHPEAPTMEEDLAHLKNKVRAGGDFIVTQLFFDNAVYFRFVEQARALGLDCPVVPGILPILSLASVKRLLSFCNACLPADYLAALEEADGRGPEAVRRLGVDYAARQCRELLAGGAPGVHLYTLNKAEACLEIVEQLK